MTACPASDLLRIDARRYHEARCQKRFADESASSCVASSRSSLASHSASAGPAG